MLGMRGRDVAGYEVRGCGLFSISRIPIYVSSLRVSSLSLTRCFVRCMNGSEILETASSLKSIFLLHNVMGVLVVYRGCHTKSTSFGLKGTSLKRRHYCAS